MTYPAIPPGGGWRLLTIVLFLLVMAVWAWMVRWGVDNLPKALTDAVFFIGLGLAAGYLIGLKSGRRQERRREEELR